MAKRRTTRKPGKKSIKRHDATKKYLRWSIKNHKQRIVAMKKLKEAAEKYRRLSMGQVISVVDFHLLVHANTLVDGLPKIINRHGVLYRRTLRKLQK